MTTIWTKITELIQAELPAADAFSQLLKYCTQSAPESNWNRFTNLPVEKDLASLKGWLLNLMSSEAPPATTNGLWFGLFDMVRPDEEASTELYLAGSECFTREDEWHDWASSPSYWPQGRYAGSLVTDQISRLSAQLPELPTELSGYALNLAYISFFVAQMAREHAPELLGEAVSRGMAVGYDDGDAILIGLLSGSRFEAIGI